jgi:hypothetical protein
MFKRKPIPYTQAEIKLQQGIVAEAMAQRRNIEMAKVEEYKRASTAVECSQEILNFMLQSVLDEHL